MAIKKFQTLEDFKLECPACGPTSPDTYILVCFSRMQIKIRKVISIIFLQGLTVTDFYYG